MNLFVSSASATNELIAFVMSPLFSYFNILRWVFISSILILAGIDIVLDASFFRIFLLIRTQVLYAW